MQKRTLLLPAYLPFFFFFCIAVIGCNKETEWKPGSPLPKEKVKIAFIHVNDYNGNSFYDNCHYRGTLEMLQNTGLSDSQIIRKVNVFDGDPGVVEGVIRDCIAEGANIIIASSWGYMKVCEKLAAEFPRIFFAHATGTKFNNSNFVNYSLRLYQASYLCGIAAGKRTLAGKIGFVAAMGRENSEVTGVLNAFAIGIESVNPAARVYVQITHSWYDPMGENDAANDLIETGCDVLAAHCDSSKVQTAAQKAGVWAIGFNGDMSAEAPDAVITSIIPRWGVIYTRLIENIINGTSRQTTYYYGFSENAVEITPLNEKLAAPGTQVIVSAAQQSIMDGSFKIFEGILETNNNGTAGEAGKTFSDEVLLGGLNWYYRNIIEQ